MNNVSHHPASPVTPLPSAPVHPGPQQLNPQPATPHLSAPHPGTSNPGAPLPEEGKKLNPLGLGALALMALLTITGIIDLLFIEGSFNFMLPRGISWVGVVVLAIVALFMKGKEKVTATIALTIGGAVIIFIPLLMMIGFAIFLMLGNIFA